MRMRWMFIIGVLLAIVLGIAIANLKKDGWYCVGGWNKLEETDKVIILSCSTDNHYKVVYK